MTLHRATLIATLITTMGACGSKPPEPAKAPVEPPPTVAAAPVAPPPEAEKPAPPPVDPAKVKADLSSAETVAYEKAKPVFAKFCASCHTKSGKQANKKKLDHFDMTSYPFGGAHAKSIGNEIRVTLAIDGHKKATMPSDKPGTVTGDDLALIKAWTEAWQEAGKGGVHPAEPADKDDD